MKWVNGSWKYYVFMIGIEGEDEDNYECVLLEDMVVYFVLN